MMHDITMYHTVQQILVVPQFGGRIWALPPDCSRESHSRTFLAAKAFRGYKKLPTR
jgi:hypothetical protein